jgi:hypothetical protein
MCVCENCFAKAGGRFAVASHLPAKITEQGGRVLVLSPLHTLLASAPTKVGVSIADSPPRRAAQTSVPFDGRDVELTLWEHDLNGVRWILFEAPGFFEAAGVANLHDLAMQYSWEIAADQYDALYDVATRVRRE